MAKAKKTKKPARAIDTNVAAPGNTNKKAKQLKLPAEGMARKAIAELDKAAEVYRAARNTRMEHTKIEKEKKTLLMEVVKKHGITNYIYEDEDGDEEEVECEAATKENVKVKKVKPDDDEDA